jgi:hypothetical protein
MDIAKIDKKTDIVVNIEAASLEWFESHIEEEDFYYIERKEKNDPIITVSMMHQVSLSDAKEMILNDELEDFDWAKEIIE